MLNGFMLSSFFPGMRRYVSKGNTLYLAPEKDGEVLFIKALCVVGFVFWSLREARLTWKVVEVCGPAPRAGSSSPGGSTALCRSCITNVAGGERETPTHQTCVV